MPNDREFFGKGTIVKYFKRELDPKRYLYQIVNLANDVNTGNLVVVYRGLYDDWEWYVREYDDFMSEVDHDKYPDIKQKYKFERYLDNEVQL